MANVWEGDTYNITKIEVSTLPGKAAADGTSWTAGSEFDDDSDEISNLEITFLVTVQRLPQSTYPLVTEVLVDRNPHLSSSLPFGISNADLLANIIPIVNTSIAAYDASYDGSSPVSTDKSGFSLKII